MSLKAVQAGAHVRHDGDQPRDEFAGPWFNSRTAARYVCCKTVKSFYMWRRRHGIIPRNNGSVAKADLDAVLRARKPRRVMSPRSLANLSHAAESAGVRPVNPFKTLEGPR